MIWRTNGIKVTAPVKWQRYDGLVSVFWEAESQAGATGYYLSADPRIMIFFNDISSHIKISNRNGDFLTQHRPMAQAIYVPPGVPMWTMSNAQHRFSHLNLHMHRDRMLQYLSPSIGSSAALTALHSPVEIQNAGALKTLADLLVKEVSQPSKHSLYAENLTGSIVTGLVDIPDVQSESDGRLTQAQMNKLITNIEAQSDGRMTVSDMAAVVGLSESWFSTVFKQTTGKTPLQWQLANRIERAKKQLLENKTSIATIAVHLGFTDQAHFTKAFRQIAGVTPAAWRRNMTQKAH